jgi:hypothetical protein
MWLLPIILPKLQNQNQNQFHQITTKYNFSKSQTNSNMYKSYIHTINFYETNAIKQVNTQTNFIYYIKMQKIYI